MKKVIRLDKQDVEYLVGLMLENEIQTPSNQQSNVIQMINDKEMGIIVSLFIILLTDDDARYELTNLAEKYNQFLSKGGNEADFTKKFTSQLHNLGTAFQQTLRSEVNKQKGKIFEGMNVTPEITLKRLKGDLIAKTDELEKLKEKIKINPELKKDSQLIITQGTIEDDIEEIKKQLEKFGVTQYDITQNKLRNIAVDRIKDLNNDPKLSRVFSMFLSYLTDSKTIDDFKRLGGIFGDKLDELISDKSKNWIHDAGYKIKQSLEPIINQMGETINKTPETTPDTTQPTNTIQSDQDKVQNIMNKYNLKL